MKTIELIQGTPEWHTWRRHVIGGSDAASVMGIGFMTTNQLWLNKLGLYEPTITHMMNRGHDLEQRARELCCERYGVEFKPACGEHDERSWQGASFDGIDPKHTVILEIKTGGKAALERAISGNIPDKYFCQIQHQLEVSGLDKCIYVFFDGENIYPIEVYRNTKYIHQLNEAEERFWSNLISWTAPPCVEKEYEVCESEIRIKLAQEWREVSERHDRDEKRLQEIKEALIADAGERNTIGGGVKITLTARAGNVDYKAIPELRGKDLGTYRKPPTKYFRFSKT